MLGICLGHQCLIQAFGGRVARARKPLHGEAATVRHNGGGLFAGCPAAFPAGRYHSLIGEIEDGGELIANAWSEEGEIMGVMRRSAPWHGLQFHPESLLTPDGRRLVENFVQLTKRAAA
jgi:anthranilate synthase component 2/para-aminobenzoate synthetase component 2